MKFILFVLFLPISGWIHAQLLSDSLLTRFCRNEVIIDDRFIIEPSDNPGFDVRFITSDKKKHQHVYILKPISSGKTSDLFLRSGDKSEKTIIPLTISDPQIRVFTHYPRIEDRFDLSLGLEHLKFKLFLSNTGMPFTDLSNSFELVNEGRLIADKREIYHYLTEQRPDSVLLTNIGFKNERMEVRANDTLTVKLIYPPEKDPEKWCKETGRDTLLISGEDFMNVDSRTMNIDSSPCLYIRFDDDGTENDITIEALSDGKRILIREFCCGEPIPLLNSTYLNGLYRVTMKGDGNHHGTLYLQVK